jgi:serine/threonine-protein kinase RsbW
MVVHHCGEWDHWYDTSGLWKEKGGTAMAMGRGVTLRYRCRPETVPMARRRVTAELRRHGIDPDLAERLVLAMAEACNNAITHSDASSYAVTVDVCGGMCVIAVIDSGGGFEVPETFEMPAPHEVSRRGLALMNALVDEVEVTSTGAGTTVVLRQPLGIRVAQVVAAS